MKKSTVFLCFFAVFLFPVSAEISGGQNLRSFNEIFPGLSEERKTAVFGENGFIRATKKNGSLELVPAANSGIQIRDTVTGKNLPYLVESLMVLPYSGRTMNKLDAYNALGKIRDLKGRLYHSHTRNEEVPLFEDATRIESAKRNRPVSDPRPAGTLPSSETVFIRLKDINFGNSFYRANFSAGTHGVTYNLTNFKSLTYIFFTVMKEENFSATLYIEPLNEGMLVYSVAGANASDFVAGKVSIPSAISKRLAVFIGWVRDGLNAVR